MASTTAIRSPLATGSPSRTNSFRDAPDDRRADAHVVARRTGNGGIEARPAQGSLAHGVEDIDGIAIADHERARNRGRLIGTIAANDARSAAPPLNRKRFRHAVDQQRHRLAPRRAKLEAILSAPGRVACRCRHRRRSQLLGPVMRIKQHVRDAEADGAGGHRRALRQSGELATDQTRIECRALERGIANEGMQEMRVGLRSRHQRRLERPSKRAMAVSRSFPDAISLAISESYMGGYDRTGFDAGIDAQALPLRRLEGRDRPCRRQETVAGILGAEPGPRSHGPRWRFLPAAAATVRPRRRATAIPPDRDR